MIRLIIFLGLLYVAYRVIKSILPSIPQERDHANPGAGEIADEMVQDPVCGVFLPRREAIRVNQNTGDVYFCSNECKTKYLESKTDTIH